MYLELMKRKQRGKTVDGWAKDHGLRTKDQGRRTKDDGRRTRDQRPNSMHNGPRTTKSMDY